jgi:hypothetical protein
MNFGIEKNCQKIEFDFEKYAFLTETFKNQLKKKILLNKVS